MRRPVLAAAALVALAVVLAALPIGSDVYEGGEAREGLVVREMLHTGDWILPLWNGSVVPSKPPLFHWLAAGAAALSGAGVTEHTLRAPSIAPAGLVVLLVFLAGRAGGWYGLAYHHRGMDFVAKQIVSENGEALLGSSRFPYRSPLFYLAPLVLAGLPWTLVLPWALARGWRSGDLARRHAVVWAAVVLVFFSLAPLKRAAYLLPLRPALALVIGWWLAEAAEEERPAGGWVAVGRGLAVVAAAGLLALAAAAGAVHWGLVPGVSLIEQGARHEIDAATYLRVVAAAWAAIGAVGLTGALAAALAARALGRARWREAALATAAAVACTTVVVYGLFVPARAAQKSVKPFAHAVRDRLRPDDRLALLASDEEIPFIFHVGRNVPVLAPAGARPRDDVPAGYYILDQARWRAWGAPAGWEEVLASPHLFSTHRHDLVLVRRRR